jgi:hypothetical protein
MAESENVFACMSIFFNLVLSFSFSLAVFLSDIFCLSVVDHYNLGLDELSFLFTEYTDDCDVEIYVDTLISLWKKITKIPDHPSIPKIKSGYRPGPYKPMTSGYGNYNGGYSGGYNNGHGGNNNGYGGGYRGGYAKGNYGPGPYSPNPYTPGYGPINYGTGPGPIGYIGY